MQMKDKNVPPSVGEFAIGERDQLLARVAELEAAQKIEIDWDSGEGSDAVPAIDRAIEEIAAMANKHNDNDRFQEAEQIARYALATALYNPKLLADTLAALKQPSAGVDERSAFDLAYQCAVDNGWESTKELARYMWDKARAQLAAPAPAPAVAYKDDPRTPQELSTAGCRCVRFGEGNPHWPCSIHPAPTVEPAHSDDVSVPRATLEFWANDLALHGVGDIESAQQIDDLLNGGRDE